MTTSIYLDKARNPINGKRWAIWLREWDGIDKPDHTQIVDLTDEMAKSIERSDQVKWQSPPDWERVNLENEKTELAKRILDIERKLAR